MNRESIIRNVLLCQETESSFFVTFERIATSSCTGVSVSVNNWHFFPVLTLRKRDHRTNFNVFTEWGTGGKRGLHRGNYLRLNEMHKPQRPYRNGASCTAAKGSGRVLRCTAAKRYWAGIKMRGPGGFFFLSLFRGMILFSTIL